MKKNLFFFIKIFFSVSLIAYIFTSVDENLLGLFKKIKHPEYLFLSVLFPLFINPIITGNRLKFFLSTLGINESLITLIKINYKSIFLGVIMPSSIGYDAVRIFEIEKRHPDKRGIAAAAIIIERSIGFLLLGSISIIGAIYVFFFLGVDVSQIIFGVLLFLFILIILIIYLSKGYLVSILSKSENTFITKAKNYLSKVAYSINSFPIKQNFFTTFFLIFSLQLAGITSCFFIFLAYDINISFANHLLLIPVIQILTVIPISFSGIGIREGAFIYFYGLLGVDNEISLIVSVLFYFFNMIIPAIIGFIIYLITIISEKF